MPQKNHEQAVSHHEEAAKNHKLATKHASEGNHEKAAHQAQAAHGHSQKAKGHSNKASEKYAEKESSMPILLWFFPYIILSAGYQLALAPRASRS